MKSPSRSSRTSTRWNSPDRPGLVATVGRFARAGEARAEPIVLGEGASDRAGTLAGERPAGSDLRHARCRRSARAGLGVCLRGSRRDGAIAIRGRSEGRAAGADLRQRLNHATLLGLVKPGELKTSLPAVLHLPDMGSFRITCNVPGQKLDYDAQRRWTTVPFVRWISRGHQGAAGDRVSLGSGGDLPGDCRASSTTRSTTASAATS